MMEAFAIHAKSLIIGKNQSVTPLNVKQQAFVQKTFYQMKFLREKPMVESTKEYYLKQIAALELKVTELEMKLDDAYSKLMVAK